MALLERARPRFSERGLARLHFADGRCHVVLHDVQTGECSAITPAQWVLLGAADGTRDPEGVLLAASREGVNASRDALARLLSEVDAAGLIEDGPLVPLRARRGSADGGEADPADAEGVAAAGRARPIARLPGYAFDCDRGGRCCRTYATVVFSPLEAARARSLLPNVLDLGDRHEHGFTPERGAGPAQGSAIALVDGGCAFLDGTLCSLHRAAGPTSKPVGCNLFPLSLVDDGSQIRAAVTVECACVLSSAHATGGQPLFDPDARTRADLDPSIPVETLPPRVDLTGTRSAPLVELVRFSDAALDAMVSATTADAPSVAWSLAASIEADPGPVLDPSSAGRAIRHAPPVDVDAALRHVTALGARAARLAAQNAWRSPRDLVRRGLTVVTAAAEILRDRDVLGAVVLEPASARVALDEAFYLRAVLFGHQLVGPPVAAGLRVRGVAMWIARVVPLAASLLGIDDEPGFDHPLAHVEALLRGYGLRLYVRTLTSDATATS